MWNFTTVVLRTLNNFILVKLVILQVLEINIDKIVEKTDSNGVEVDQCKIRNKESSAI